MSDRGSEVDNEELGDEDLFERIDRIEYEVVRARRAAETTRTIAIVFGVLFLVLPLVMFLVNLLRFNL